MLTVGGAKVGRGAAGGAGSADGDEDAAWQTAARDFIDELGKEDSGANKRGKGAQEYSVSFACFFCDAKYPHSLHVARFYSFLVREFACFLW